MSDHLIMCPHCGAQFDPNDPANTLLRPVVQLSWHILRDALTPGEPASAEEIGAIIGVSRQHAYEHIRPLINVGLLREEPKRENGTYMVYLLA